MDINKMTKEQIEYRIRQIDGREMFLISADYMTDELKFNDSELTKVKNNRKERNSGQSNDISVPGEK